ncbi:MAG: ubiquinol-cytochrome c reductase iron-sulfur subunit [Candidatus Dormibacteria bacterium]
MARNPYAETPQRHHRMAAMSRRSFLVLVGGLGALGSVLFGGMELLKFVFPNATGEAPLKFKASVRPEAITVDNPYMDYGHRTGILRDDAGIYAVELVCTHLGCTPNYVSNVTAGSGVADAVADSHGVRKPPERIPNGWACPCHGSRYFIDSTNFYGPAPRPMDWYDIQFGPDGSLVVDRGALVVSRGAGDTTTPLWRLDPVSKKDNGKTYGV